MMKVYYGAREKSVVFTTRWMNLNSFLPVIQHSELFAGIPAEEISKILDGMKAYKQTYAKGNFIWYAGDPIGQIGIVLSGMVHILQEDYWGNRNILSQMRPGSLFGEAFACIPDASSTVDVVAVEPTEVLFINVNSIIHAGQVLTRPQERVALNLLAIMARRNRELTQKIRYMSQRSTRQKLMFYLSEEALRQGSPSFTLPFNRQQLADFLSVDRSAMSAELSRMKKEGLIEYHKDQFILKEQRA